VPALIKEVNDGTASAQAHLRERYGPTLAFFAAVGGGAYAATALPRNSVTTAQLAPGAVKTSDIGKGAVTSAKVKDGSLLAVDFKAGQLPAGAKGDKGDPGAQGLQGAKGEPGATNVVVRERVVANVGGAASQDETIQCAAGEEAIAGGGGMSIAGSRSFGNNHIETSTWLSTPVDASGLAPADGTTATGWRVSLRNNGGSARDYHGYVVCVSP
jgi:hypothetical protein